MTFSGRLAPVLTWRRIPGVFRTVAFLLAAAVLAGCGDGLGALTVDPTRYDGYRCKDLVPLWQGLVVREKQLRNLINKADEGGGGTVIGALAYRGDYQTVLEQEKVLQRAAAAEKCELVATAPPPRPYSSDQVIR